MVLFASSFRFRQVMRTLLVYQKPARTCSLCSGSTSSNISTPLGAASEDVERMTTFQDPDPASSVEDPQATQVVALLNSLPESDLKTMKYINSKMAAGIVAHRDKHGLFSGVDELLVIPGIGRRTLDKFVKYFSEGKLEKRATRIEPQSSSFADIPSERLANMQDIVSIDVGLKHIAWLHMDRERWVHSWHCKIIEGISPGKWDPVNYLRLVSDTVKEMPCPNLYVLEHKSFTSLNNKGTFQTMLFVRCIESMLYTNLNSDLSDSGQLKAISLPQNLVGRHFDLLVGTQRKSGQVLARALLDEGFERRNSWFPVRIGYGDVATFDDANKYKREHLANCLLRAVAFYDIYIDKKPGFKMR